MAYPYPHVNIAKLTEDREFLAELEQELQQLTYIEKANDLYRFRQTEELAKCKASCVVALQYDKGVV